MATQQTDNLKAKSCQPCEGGVDPLSEKEAQDLLKRVEDWQLADDGKKIVRKLTTKDFLSGIEYLQSVAKVAEEENHHPDVHLTGYKNVKIELTTHAIGGLSENDFILAAKIDELPVELDD